MFLEWNLENIVVILNKFRNDNLFEFKFIISLIIYVGWAGVGHVALLEC